MDVRPTLQQHLETKETTVTTSAESSSRLQFMHVSLSDSFCFKYGKQPFSTCFTAHLRSLLKGPCCWHGVILEYAVEPFERYITWNLAARAHVLKPAWVSDNSSWKDPQTKS